MGGLPGVNLNKLAESLGLPVDKLRMTLQTMRHEGLSFAEAAKVADMDLSGIDPIEFAATLNDVPESMQGQFLQDADQLPAVLRETVESAFTAPQDTASSTGTDTSGRTGDASNPTNTATNNTTPGTTGAPNTGGTSGTGSTSTAVINPAGNAPPGQQPAVLGRTEGGTPIDSSLRFVPGNIEVRPADTLQNNSLINRLFNGEGARTDAGQNINTVQTRATVGADVIQNPNAVIHARADGNSAAYSPAAQASNAFATQQSTPQASAFAGQQAAAQAQVADRAMAESALPQYARGGETAVASFRAAESAVAPAVQTDRTLAAQQQLLAQPVPAPQGRPDISGAQVMAQLAGATVIANPQAHTMANQLGQNVMPAPPGAENAAASARDSLLAPAGHTLAGFLRRDHRGRADTMGRRGQDWLLAMLAANRKRPAEGEPEAMSVQWLFWILTIAAYGALATAVIVMIPSGGRLLDSNGNVSFGAYALIAGGVAALLSWIVGRRLGQPRARNS